MNHINAVIGDFDDTVDLFARAFGAQFLSDMPKDEWHACLVAVSDVIFQFFSPHDHLLHARIGPHYVGVEYVVPDVAAAREDVGARGMRIVRELGSAFHLHPGDAYGVALEFYDQDFHAVPSPVPYVEPIKPMSAWRDDHPCAISGLERYIVAVSDLDAATGFFTDFVDGRVIGAGLIQLGVTKVELVKPAGGLLAEHHARFGDGIVSTVFSTADLAGARSHLQGLGLDVADDGSVLVGGLLFQLVE